LDGRDLRRMLEVIIRAETKASTIGALLDEIGLTHYALQENDETS